MRIFSWILLAVMFITMPSFAQNKDKAIFRNVEPGFYQLSILKDNSVTKDKIAPEKPQPIFAVDMQGMDLPNKISLYKNVQWHNPPISQGNTGTCWCFSTTSFLESEAFRLHGVKVKLSEMYTVYWEYVEKATRFVKERGNSLFDEGAEANAVTDIWKKYGIVPESEYNGLEKGRTTTTTKPW